VGNHLWEVEHPYYCNLGNFYSNDCGQRYNSFDDFLGEWGDADMDYNLLFRWDWREAEYYRESNDEDVRTHDILEIFWMLQRKGAYTFCEIKVTKDEEQKVINFLRPRWEYMARLWRPFF
jgi:hypothetical protein